MYCHNIVSIVMQYYCDNAICFVLRQISCFAFATCINNLHDDIDTQCLLIDTTSPRKIPRCHVVSVSPLLRQSELIILCCNHQLVQPAQHLPLVPPDCVKTTNMKCSLCSSCVQFLYHFPSGKSLQNALQILKHWFILLEVQVWGCLTFADFIEGTEKHGRSSPIYRVQMEQEPCPGQREIRASASCHILQQNPVLINVTLESQAEVREKGGGG